MINNTKKIIIGIFGGLFSLGVVFFAVPIFGPIIAFFGVASMAGGISIYLVSQMRKAFWNMAQSKNIELVKRQDGMYEMVDADYYTGWLKSKYGFHIMAEKTPEVNTGKMVSICLDMWGASVKPEDIAAVQEFSKKYAIQNATQLEDILDKWSRCTHCKHEGIPKIDTIEKETTVGGVKQKIIEHSKPVCAECGKNQLENVTPSVLVPFYRTVSLDDFHKFLKYKMNPSKAMSLVDRLMKIKQINEGHDFGRMIAYGFFLLLGLVGVGVFLKIVGVL